jgi:Collagen triple helix repeat (20 copies)
MSASQGQFGVNGSLNVINNLSSNGLAVSGNTQITGAVSFPAGSFISPTAISFPQSAGASTSIDFSTASLTFSNGQISSSAISGGGVAGPTGPQGPQGQAGTNGTNGANDSNGSTGVTGYTGRTGPAGTNGSNGTNGTNGSTGATGPVGTFNSSNDITCNSLTTTTSTINNLTASTVYGVAGIGSPPTLTLLQNANDVLNVNGSLNVNGTTSFPANSIAASIVNGVQNTATTTSAWYYLPFLPSASSSSGQTLYTDSNISN